MRNFLLVITLFVSQLSFGNVTLPSVFSDHMVLQQNEKIKIWGWASPNEVIQIKPSWTDEIYKTGGLSSAKWEIIIQTPLASPDSHSITVSGYNKITIQDVLVGEVWLCSGQSNMEMSAAWGIKKGEDAVQKADYPTIRFFRVEKSSVKYPQDHIIGKWEVCSPETMRNNSAVAYYFSRQLQQHLIQIPVGLIISAWGGTPAEIWMPESVIETDKELSQAANNLTPQEWGPHQPGRAFNAMIYPIYSYQIAGVLWYQGESNVGSKVYDLTLTALIKSWRQLWQKQFPFYIVQIAPYDDGNDHDGGVQIREAQRKVAGKVKNSGLVVISDVSTVDDIHPKDKKPVGVRLANLALKQHYKQITGVVESPEIDTVLFNKRKAVLHFENAEGLYTNNELSLFEIAGEENKFYPATSKLKNEVITLSSSKVKHPVKVRFAWGNASKSNVFNAVDLPLSSFFFDSSKN